MDRLTIRANDGRALLAPNLENKYGAHETIISQLVRRLASYEDAGISPEDLNEAKEVISSESYEAAKIIDHVCCKRRRVLDIARAELEGRLKILPARWGAIVYEVYYDCGICGYLAACPYVIERRECYRKKVAIREVAFDRSDLLNENNPERFRPGVFRTFEEARIARMFAEDMYRRADNG